VIIDDAEHLLESAAQFVVQRHVRIPAISPTIGKRAASI
jgi:hypothetical protein